MSTKSINPTLILALMADFPDIINHIRKAKPVIYNDGDAYCCVSGPNAVEGIFGCGDSPADALKDWEKSYQKVLKKEK